MYFKGSGNVARLVDRLSKDISTLQKGVPIKRRPNKKTRIPFSSFFLAPKPGNNNSRIATVRFSYAAQQEDELTLLEDDVIEVMEDVEDGWARGKLKDKIGMFPTNFVSFSTATTTNTSELFVHWFGSISKYFQPHTLVCRVLTRNLERSQQKRVQQQPMEKHLSRRPPHHRRVMEIMFFHQLLRPVSETRTDLPQQTTQHQPRA